MDSGPEVVAPDGLEDLGPAQDPARIAQEQLQQRQLRLGQLQAPAAAFGPAAAQVQFDVGEAQHLGLRAAAPQQGPEPGPQFLQSEGLGQVVVGPRVQPGDPVGDQVPGREHQDRRVVPARTQRPADLQPVRFGHEDVEHHRVRAEHAVLGEGGRPISGGCHVVAVAAQRVLQGPPHSRVIVHHKYPHGRPSSPSIMKL